MIILVIRIIGAFRDLDNMVHAALSALARTAYPISVEGMAARNHSTASATSRTLDGPGVAAALEDEIITGGRFPGERLVEDQLIEKFGAKRYAVRQALMLLEKQGLVDRRPNAGAFVRSYTEKEVRDLYDLRILLEGECAQSIELPVSTSALAQLRSVQQNHDDAVAAMDLPQVLAANTAFHRTLFDLCPNRVLVEAVNRYAGMSHAMRSIAFTSAESLERSRREHHQMIESLESGNTDGLTSLCRDHLLPSRDTYLRSAARRA